MEPLILPDALVLLDRHYNFADAVSAGPPIFTGFAAVPTDDAVCGFCGQPAGAAPYNIAFPVELVELEPSETPSDRIAGRWR